MSEENKKKDLSFYTFAFLIYCIIGWIYEVIWEFAVGNGFVNRGFLFGPYLPIYGFGVLILYFLLSKEMKKDIRIFKKIKITPIIVFLLILIIVSVIEYFASFVMELIFHKRWWDYSYDWLNINGRISLRNSSLLAIGAMFMLYLIFPIIEKVTSKIPNKIMNYMKYAIWGIIGIDFVVTILGYLI